MGGNLTILSGGQSGVDRGALDAALALGRPCGGWCPAGRQAEDGPIPARYPLAELAGGYPERTRRNVEDSDGTLILHFGELTGGSRLTHRLCADLGKPVCLVDGERASPGEAARMARRFVDRHGIARLNVAGPRAGHCPQAHGYARDAIEALLRST